MLKDLRRSSGLTQSEAARRAGTSQSTWSYLEIGGDGRTTLSTWTAAATALGASFEAFVRGGTGADMPHDAVHLRNQELVIRASVPGGWTALPEEPIDRRAGASRSADVLLHRRRTRAEYVIVEVWDWFDDVGRMVRDWDRRLAAVEEYGIRRMRGDEPLPVVGGCWVIRATQRNRRLLADHNHFFRARFPGSGAAWMAALTRSDAPVPARPALLWVSVRGDRIFPARLAGEQHFDPRAGRTSDIASTRPDPPFSGSSDRK